MDDDLQALERFVAENDDLLSLEEQIGRFNVFDALGIARREIRHSNYLAWLLSPWESHAQGELFLVAFVMDVLRKGREQGVTLPVSAVELDGADLRGVDVKREWKNIDLLITCDEPRFVIAVENKIDSGEHGNQLQRYEDRLEHALPDSKKLFVFLTADAEEASDDDWVNYSYADLFRALSRTRRANSGAVGGDVAVFLDHYLSLIGDQFMANEQIDKLCKRIYANHRRAIDLINERVGATTSGLLAGIEEWLRKHESEWHVITTKQKEIEFIPRSWMAMLPSIGRRKTFVPTQWMTVRIRIGSTKLRLFVIVCPTTDVALRKAWLDRVLQNREEFGFSSFFKKKELTGDWTRILSEEICPISEDEEPEVETIMPRVEARLEAFLKQAERLPEVAASVFPNR